MLCANETHASRRPAILVTGFGPFPGVETNPTSTLVPALTDDARLRHPDFEFASAILPTQWDAAPRHVVQLIQSLQPCLVLHFGAARQAQGFRIERRAKNWCRSTVDAAGRLPTTNRVRHTGPDIHDATLPHDAILERLAQHGLPAALSDDAGGFLCNAVLYHSLAEAASQPRPFVSGFIHIPADLSGPPLTFAEALRGGRYILQTLIEALDQSR